MKAKYLSGQLVLCLTVFLTIPLLTGCETLAQQRAREEMRRREDMLVMQESSQRVEARIEALEFEIGALRRELDRVQQDTLRATEMEMETLEGRVNTTERKVASLESNRARDRQEIIDTLSKKMADVLQRTASSSSSRSGRRSEYGYEHVVKSGETLSEIASAYGVSVKTIIEENNITNPNLLRAGQVLFVPE